MFRSNFNGSKLRFDRDGINNDVDIDDDNDGVPDYIESCVSGNQVNFQNVQDVSTAGDWTTFKLIWL
ncbi:MAG: hypothetical protein IPO26_10920 [Saprospiraceae bacterium]|nr:hypothetical protein [Saprospiraceae bacterium]